MTTTLPFGKHCGLTLEKVAAEDPSYLRWLLSALDYGAEHADEIKAALRAGALKLLESAPAHDLTPHQQERADKILTAVAAGRPTTRLEGAAGCGKSYVTRHIAVELLQKGFNVRAMAVSYVAAQVLRRHLDPIGVETATVARTLRFDVEYRDGEQEYVHSADTPEEADKLLSPGSVLIVDECSMINDRDAGLLFETAQRRGGHLILIGDSRQLPPVKQEHLSQCCTALPDDFVAELKVPMRYGLHSHLFKIEQAARKDPYDLLFGDSPVCPLILPSEELTLVKSTDALMARYVRYFREDTAARHRMLLFRRRDVVRANNAIRRHLFGPDADVVEEDEQLMILRTGDTPADSDDSVRYYSGQTFRVLEKHKETYLAKIGDTEYRIPHWYVQFDNGQPPVRIIFGVTEAHMDGTKLGGLEYQRALQAARDYGIENQEWSYYMQLRADFVCVAYQYATSVHRAQGQTVDYAYCRPAELLAVRGILGKALTYVALTRAKKHLTVF